MMRLFAGAVLASLGVPPALAAHHQGCNGAAVPVPDNLNLVCSATWQLTGTCAGQDMWDKWKVFGRTNPEDSFIRPFEDVPIIVIGYELLKLESVPSEPTSRPAERSLDKELNDRNSWFMIGSAISSQPDAMLFLGPGERRTSRMWPAGMGQLWPSKNAPRQGKLQDMINLHGVCWGGGHLTIFLTIYYTPQSE